jgi:hypothetical protein
VSLALVGTGKPPAALMLVAATTIVVRLSTPALAGQPFKHRSVIVRPQTTAHSMGQLPAGKGGSEIVSAEVMYAKKFSWHQRENIRLAMSVGSRRCAVVMTAV